MSELRQLLEEFLNRELRQIVLSNSRDPERGTKVKLRPVEIKGKLYFQETLYRGTQVFHENRTPGEAADQICQYLTELFKQGECRSDGRAATILVSKKGKMTVKVRSLQGKETGGESAARGAGKSDNAPSLQHNRPKQYILQEGTPVDFLVELGVQTADGRVIRARFDKFRQINRYLEFIEDVVDALPADRTLRIIDFGCGKSYLTFAMYYFLHELQGREIEVTGLDLKADVIARCNELAERLGYAGLHFVYGDISSYEGAKEVDLVVSLHACDTATDFALEKAVRWGARVIMAVPCCQHEVNGQLQCGTLQPILKYGLLKERFSAIVTDAVRANLLEQNGYDTQILEFIDMEHTPKNLLIRAVKRDKMQPAGRRQRLEEMTEFLQVAPTLEKLLCSPELSE